MLFLQNHNSHTFSRDGFFLTKMQGKAVEEAPRQQTLK